MKTLSALFMFAALTTASAQWHVISQSEPRMLGHGVWQEEKEVVGEGKVKLQLIHCSVAKVEIAVAAQTASLAKDALKLDNWGRSLGAIAICNGGYFDPPKFAAAGLQISSGLTRGAFIKGLPFGGGFMVTDGKPAIYIDTTFPGLDKASSLIQSCPILVDNGLPIDEKKGGPVARRTFLITDQADNWVIGISSGIGLTELANLLTTPGVFTSLKVTRALNLDGGPSTGLWCRDASGVEHYSKEGWPVPNAIIIKPKS